jgi:hypothetical protein
MDFLLMALLPAILFIGIITSYQDFKYGKIKNKWIIFGLIYTLFIYLFFLLFYSSFGGINIKYLAHLGVNILFAIFVGFGLWDLKVWAAGDGKLFIVYSFLVPLSVYASSSQSWFPSLDILVNTFSLAFIFLLIVLFLKSPLNSLSRIGYASIKNCFQPKPLFFGAITLFSLMWIFGFFLSFFNPSNILLIMFIFLILFLLIPKKYQDKINYLFLFLALLRFFLDKTVYSITSWKTFFILFLLFFILRGILGKLLDTLGQEFFSKDVEVDKLKEGMVLSKSIVKLSKLEFNHLKNKKEQIVCYKGKYYTQVPKTFFNLDEFIKESSEGLTKTQINLIKLMGFKKLKISRTTSFASFMFLGVLFILFLRENIFSFLRGIF